MRKLLVLMLLVMASVSFAALKPPSTARAISWNRFTTAGDFVYQDLMTDKSNWNAQANVIETDYDDIVDSDFSQTDGNSVLFEIEVDANYNLIYTFTSTQDITTKFIKLNMYIDLNGAASMPTRLEARFTDGSAKKAKVILEVESAFNTLETGYYSFEMATSGMAYDSGVDVTDIRTMTINVLAAKDGLKMYIDSLQIVENESTPKCILTFDNGTVDHYNTVRPLLNARGMKGHFYVNKNTIDSGGTHMTTANLLQMQADGHLVGNHGAEHLDWAATPLMYFEMVEEMLENRRWLNSIGINQGQYYYAHPSGSLNTVPADGSDNLAFFDFLQQYNYHTRMTKAVGSGVSGGLVSGTTIQFGQPNITGYIGLHFSSTISIFDTGSPQASELSGKDYIDRVVSNNGAAVIYWHRIVTSPNPANQEMDPTEFEELLDYLISQGVDVVTFSDLFNWNPTFQEVPAGRRERYDSRTKYIEVF